MRKTLFSKKSYLVTPTPDRYSDELRRRSPLQTERDLSGHEATETYGRRILFSLPFFVSVSNTFTKLKRSM